MYPIAWGIQKVCLHTKLPNGTGFVYQPLHRATETPSEMICSSLLLQLSMPQACSEVQTQLAEGQFASAIASPVWAVFHTSEKRPRNKLLSWCSPPCSTSLRFGGQIQLPYKHCLSGCSRGARRDHLHWSSEQCRVSTNYCNTSANHFPSAGFWFPDWLSQFSAVMQTQNHASIICLYGLSVSSWWWDKMLSGHEWLLCFPALKRSDQNSVQVCIPQNHSWLLWS